ncbi:glycosyltransferase family 2 protein [Parvibaculum sp.]|uniref:glycosyltransferase family 2 protein n=1 Tax=Parvibaculum sp. TaxID=2024848 RepID=UPI002C234AEB|nr:glycosyltransferase family 2 protein [Parvibaculum sp.]HUD51445.1 glycosyltransferase family 2 protein [Parvibaculum sp.]
MDDRVFAPEATGTVLHFSTGLAEAVTPSGWRRPLLGELAVESGLVGREAMQGLLALQTRCGSRLGELLVSVAGARQNEVAKLLAAQKGLRFVDLAIEPADPTLADATSLDFYIAGRCMPWRWIRREPVYVAADPERARSAIETREGRACLIHVASAQDIDHALRERFYETLNERARFELATKAPENSASRRITSGQGRALGFLTLLTVIAFWLAPASTAFLLNIAFGLCFLAVAGLRFVSIFVGLVASPTAEELAFERNAATDDADLPDYTIIVPLFREAAVLPILVDALRKFDYPASRLDIKLVFEETDAETYEAARRLHLPGNFDLIRVPYSLPLTKPKACNYALPFARGEFVVVYDAEDIPDPDQLRRAVAAFRGGDTKLACVQAQLNYYNWSENWLTRQFAIEYSSFFDLLLPTLARLGMPVPLGGTSTHFRTALLRQAGAWDPFNVTEDADLGMRFALLGLRTGIIRSTTQEEANCEVDNWLRQRSRWIKGWLQTYFVRMRHPVDLYRALGLRGFIGFQIVIGGFSLASLVHPLFYLATIVSLVSAQRLGDLAANLPVVVFNITVLISGFGVTMLAGMAAAATRGLKPLVIEALMMPAYWLLISAGAYKALFQFIVRPFHWEKTVHGISRLTRAQLLRILLSGDRAPR